MDEEFYAFGVVLLTTPAKMTKARLPKELRGKMM
jgi:hypothetical protein